MHGIAIGSTNSSNFLTIDFMDELSKEIGKILIMYTDTHESLAKINDQHTKGKQAVNLIMAINDIKQLLIDYNPQPKAGILTDLLKR